MTDHPLDLLLSELNKFAASNEALVAEIVALKAEFGESNAKTVQKVTAQATAIEATFKRAEQTHRETLAGVARTGARALWRNGAIAMFGTLGVTRRGRHRDIFRGPDSCHFRADGRSLCDDAGRTGRRRACVLGDAARRRGARGADRHLCRATGYRHDFGSVLARLWPPDLLGRAALAGPIAGWCRCSGCPFDHARRSLRRFR